MTTLYRSPTVIIDAHEWHALVRKKGGRVTLAYYWRPLSLKSYQWSPMSSWVGPKPKAFGTYMAGFRRHIAAARSAELTRAEAIRRLVATRTAARVQNAGTPMEMAA